MLTSSLACVKNYYFVIVQLLKSHTGQSPVFFTTKQKNKIFFYFGFYRNHNLTDRLFDFFEIIMP